MKKIGVLGLNHKVADLCVREVVAKAFQKHFSNGPYVLLSTCNRTEIYFGGSDLAELHEEISSRLREDFGEATLQRLYSFFGTECLNHLARVTAGLDSAIVGESEIQGQVKQAYEASFGLSSELHFLFQKSLRVGKKVRTCLDLRPGPYDTESAIFALTKRLFEAFDSLKILFVGASQINEKVFSRFSQGGVAHLALCNRSEVTPSWIHREEAVVLQPLSHLQQWHTYDVVVFGTSCPEYLLRWEDLLPLREQKLIIDLSVPRNVDPLVAYHPHVALYNIDQIQAQVEKSRKLKAQVVERAEMVVEAEVSRHASALSLAV
ncbi:MAG: glutamyl-tRNA reductase [Verrucomicrobia bacterium]|nr:glutamyl-tRNA reductase [Verrucomicrobiota bacterium]